MQVDHPDLTSAPNVSTHSNNVCVSTIGVSTSTCCDQVSNEGSISDTSTSSLGGYDQSVAETTTNPVPLNEIPNDVSFSLQFH
jgi:hypothetical protein